MLTSSRKYLLNIRIAGSIAPNTLNKLRINLNEIRHKNIDAILINIALGATSFNTTKLFIDEIENLSKEKTAPIYTFAEEMAVDTGYMLLSIGHEVNVHPFSVVGDIGRTLKIRSARKLLSKLGIEPVRISPFEKSY